MKGERVPSTVSTVRALEKGMNIRKMSSTVYLELTHTLSGLAAYLIRAHEPRGTRTECRFSCHFILVNDVKGSAFPEPPKFGA